jgi:hypothetical protein
VEIHKLPDLEFVFGHAGIMPQFQSNSAQPSRNFQQLSAWSKDTYPAAPAVPERFIEEAIRNTWHRRHEMIAATCEALND